MNVDLLTLEEAAEYLRITTVTLWKLRKSGEIRVVRIGPKKTCIRRSELERFIAEHTE